MTWNKKVPFDPTTGELMYYPRDTWTVEGRKPPDWRDNVEFEDTLKFVGFSRGCSAANADFTRSDGSPVTMFLTDLAAAMPQLFAGCLIGTFTFCKRGKNFGVRMLAPKPLRTAVPAEPVVVPLPYIIPAGQTPKEAGCGYLTRAQQQIHAGDLR